MVASRPTGSTVFQTETLTIAHTSGQTSAANRQQPNDSGGEDCVVGDGGGASVADFATPQRWAAAVAAALCWRWRRKCTTTDAVDNKRSTGEDAGWAAWAATAIVA